MPPVKGQGKRYSQEDLDKAIEEALRGSPIATAARKYGIPRVTLSNKVSGKTPRKCRMGPKTYLPEDTEKLLVEWVEDVQKAGFPVTKEKLLDAVQLIVKEKKIKTPFTNNRPGRHWLESFMKRHPEISFRSQNVTNTRATVSTEKLSDWYTEVYDYLQAEGYDAILQDPRCIFTAEESAFFLNPAGNKVLARKGDTSVYQNDDNECLTVLMSGNAAGEIPPPMVIFEHEKLPADIAFSVPDMWGIGTSENGWMTSKNLNEYIGNVLHPWLLKQNLPLPVILFIDDHSHLTLATSDLCVKLGIILVSLYPNAAQPFDVSIFPALRSYWKSEVHNWKIINCEYPSIQKIHFCGVLKEVISKLDVSLFENGFRKCGLYPWDPSAGSGIDENDMVIEKKAPEKLTALQDKFNFIQSHIERSKLERFNNCDVWTGAVEDKSLFLFYKKIQALCQEEQTDLKCNDIEDSVSNDDYHIDTKEIKVEVEIIENDN